jgi:hypothetical protein
MDRSATADSTLPENAAALEIERFEWAAPDRIELTGEWSGLRARRFVRPTLILHGAGKRRRLLATLEHKPWAPEDGQTWIAAFAWEGEPVEFESAELGVGSGIDLELPPPRLEPGKPARRFKHRAVSRGEGTASVDETAALDGATRVDEPGRTGGDPASDLQARLDAALAEAAQLRGERDNALEQTRKLRRELELAKQVQEAAVRDARAEERASATSMLDQGADLRASVERQREMAFTAREEAERARDEAHAARDKAIDERHEALDERKAALRERDEACRDRDRANDDRDKALAAREKALQEADRRRTERDQAVKERDEILALHDRGLPVVQPQPRFLPQEHRHSDQWMSRLIALGLLLSFAIVVLKLFAAG